MFSHMTQLYFAYGSNLELQDWRIYCRRNGLHADGLQPLHPAVAPDHTLAFTRYSRKRGGGVLDILPRRGAAVTGMLFSVCDATLAALDHKEGAPNAYERVPITVLDGDGAEIEAFTYRVRPQDRLPFVAPHADYLAVCAAGRAGFAIDASILDDAAAGRPAGEIHTAFVYGTLMRGERGDHFWSRHETPPEPRAARVAGLLKDCGPYPGMVHPLPQEAGADTLVRGELLAFSDITTVLDDFDRYEDFTGYGAPGNVYRRVPVAAREEVAGAVTEVRAWAYILLDHDRFPVIAGGCWRSHRGTG